MTAVKNGNENMKQGTNRIKCMIIDDERDACDRLESLLNKIPEAEVISKETKPGYGIEEVINTNPDIIFLDVEMPGMSGFDVVKEIREKRLRPTFIFVTGYDQYAIKAIRSAAFDFLVKPVDIDELREAFERYIGQRNEKQKFIIPEKLKKEYSLTDREIEIVELLLEGKSSQQIGEKLFISRHTVDTHRRNILVKTGMNTTGELLSLLKF